MKKTTLTLTAAALTSACGTASYSNHGPDWFELRGTPSGIEAYHQGLHGAIEASKNADGASPYVQETYRQKERQRTRRETATPPLFKWLGVGSPKDAQRPPGSGGSVHVEPVRQGGS